MKKVLIISVNEIISNSVIEENIDQKVLSKTLTIVQENYLRPILGKELYEGLCDSIYYHIASGTSIPTIYENLIYVVKPYLISKTVSEFIIVNNYKITNKGILKYNDNSGQSLSDSDLENVRNHYDNLSSNYKSEILDFLRTSGLVQPNTDATITNEATGWFLGESDYSTYSESSSGEAPVSIDKDTYLVSGSFDNGVLTLVNNSGNTLSISGFTFEDVYLTGGTYSNGSIVFNNNTGSSFVVNGLFTGMTDINVYNSNGTLESDRTVNLTGYTFSLITSGNTIEHTFPNGNKWFGTGTPVDNGYRVDVRGKTNCEGTLRVRGTTGSNTFETYNSHNGIASLYIDQFGITRIDNGGTNAMACTLGTNTQFYRAGQITWSNFQGFGIGPFLNIGTYAGTGRSIALIGYSNSTAPDVLIGSGFPKGNTGSLIQVGGWDTPDFIGNNVFDPILSAIKIAPKVSGGVATNPTLIGIEYNPSITGITNHYAAIFQSGSIGVGTAAPTSKVDISGTTGYNQFRLRTSYTPTSTADTNGNTGDICKDDNYIYVKTSAGWKRSALSTF